MGMEFRLEQVQVHECSICGQYIRMEDELPLTCLPIDPVTRRVNYRFLVKALGTCPSCYMPLNEIDVGTVLRLWEERAQPVGSASLPFDWI